MRYLFSKQYLNLSLILLSILTAKAQTIDESFQADIKKFGISFHVRDMAVQVDNKIIIVGNFKSVEGVKRNGLARLNPDGTLDQSFNTSLSLTDYDNVTLLKLQSDGKILIGGEFVRWDGINNVTKRMLRINNDGSLDETFQVDDVSPSRWYPATLGLQTDGKIVMGWIDANPNYSAWLYKVLRLNSDGHIDETFSCNLTTPKMINDLALQQDGKLVVVGGSYQSDYLSLIERFNSDGSDDNSFNPMVGSFEPTSLSKVAISSSGDIFIGGTFTSCNGEDRKSVAKLKSDGQLDLTFNFDAAEISVVYDLILLNNEKLQVSGLGQFTNVGPTSYNYFIELNADGSVSNSFLNFTGPGVSDFTIKKIRADNNGKLLLAGEGTSLDRVLCSSLVRINPDVTIDTTFRIRSGSDLVESAVYTLCVQNDKKILIGGDFNYADNAPWNNIARLNFNGSVDPTFVPGTGANGFVYAISVQPDGKILVAGNFHYFNQQVRTHIVRLNTNGSIDPTFLESGINASCIYSLVLQADGKIVIKTILQNREKTQLVRLNSDGTVDSSFNSPVFDGIGREYFGSYGESMLGSMLPLGIQSDGKLITQDLRFNIDGSRDISFANKTGTYFVAAEPDGNILMRGGDYGYTSEPYDGLHRLHPDGSVAQIFDYDLQEYQITSLYIQPNKKLLIGRTSESNSEVFHALNRLNADGTLDPAFHGTDLNFEDRYSIKEHSTDLVLVAGTSTVYYSGDFQFMPLVRLKTNTLTEQSIAFAEIPNQLFNGALLTLALDVTSNSGLPVLLEVVAGPASILNNILTITGPGMVSVAATQQGDSEHYSAPPVTRTFFARENQQISFSTIEDIQYESGMQINLSATATSSLNVSFEVVAGACSASGNTLSVNGSGKITIKALQSGNSFYNPATEQLQTFCVNPARPSIETNADMLISSSENDNQWFINGNIILNATQSFIKFIEPGAYSVQVVTNGCSSEVSQEIIITGLEEKKIFTVQCYPNPSSHTLSIETNYALFENGIIALYNSIGSKVLVENIKSNESVSHTSLEVSILPRGVYVLEIVTSKITWRQKVILQ